jgi:hypothetical protein
VIGPRSTDESLKDQLSGHWQQIISKTRLGMDF